MGILSFLFGDRQQDFEEQSSTGRTFTQELFNSPEYFECTTPEQLEQYRLMAEERKQTATLTGKAVKHRIEGLRQNTTILEANANLWVEDAEEKTKQAKVLADVSKKQSKLAGKYVKYGFAAKGAQMKAQSRAKQLAEEFRNL